MQCRRGLAMRKLSVCLSVCQTRVLWQNGKKICPDFISYERTFSLIFWEEEWLVGATPYTWNFGSTGPHWSEIADFEPIYAHRASAVTPSENSSVNTNRKSTPHAFQWAQDDHHTWPLSPQRGLKDAKRPISV